MGILDLWRARRLYKLWGYDILFSLWIVGVARLTRLPVTEKTTGSNPVRSAIKPCLVQGFMFETSFVFTSIMYLRLHLTLGVFPLYYAQKTVVISVVLGLFQDYHIATDSVWCPSKCRIEFFCFVLLPTPTQPLSLCGFIISHEFLFLYCLQTPETLASPLSMCPQKEPVFS